MTSLAPPRGLRIAELRDAYRALIVPVWEGAGFQFAKGPRVRGVLARGEDEYVLHVLPPYRSNTLLELGQELHVSLVVTPLPKYVQHWGRERDVTYLCSEATLDRIAARNAELSAKIRQGLDGYPDWQALLPSPDDAPAAQRRAFLSCGFICFSRDDVEAWVTIFRDVIAETVAAALDVSRFPRDEAEHALLNRRLNGQPLASVLKSLKEL